MKRVVPWAEIVVALLVVSAGVAIFAYAHRDDDELEESKRRGAAIVSALETYRSANGAYPDSLSQLVPQYVQAVEPPVWGLKEWRYQVLPDSVGAMRYFQLSVSREQSGYPLLYYDVGAGRFILNN